MFILRFWDKFIGRKEPVYPLRKNVPASVHRSQETGLLLPSFFNFLLPTQEKEKCQSIWSIILFQMSISKAADKSEDMEIL